HLAKARQAPAVPFVMRYPFEKLAPVALGEICPHTDSVLAAYVDHVFDCVDIIVNRRFDTVPEERGEHGNADKSIVVCDEPKLRIAFIAWMLLQTGRQAMGISDWLFGGEDHILARLRPDMRQVA